MPPAGINPGLATAANAQPAAPPANAGMALLGQLKGAKPAPPVQPPQQQPMTVQQVHEAQARAQAQVQSQTQASNKQSADAIWKMLGGKK